MTENELQQVLNTNKYQVLLMASPIPKPFHFAIHAWFIINMQGEIHRWEFGKFRNSPNPDGIGLFRDFFHPLTGMNKYLWKPEPRFDSHLLGKTEGDENTVAAGMAHFINEHSGEYPYIKKYSYLGPNSNTYAAWVLQQFPESGLHLPASAVGKGYRRNTG